MCGGSASGNPHARLDVRRYLSPLAVLALDEVIRATSAQAATMMGYVHDRSCLVAIEANG
jgi:hypothetical protein